MLYRSLAAMILIVGILSTSLVAAQQESKRPPNLRTASQHIDDRVKALENQIVHLRKTVEDLKAALDKKGTPDTTSEFQIKVFSLLHVDAASLVQTVSRVFPGVERKTIRLAAHAHTNAVVASGKPEDLELLEILIQRLDRSKDSKNGK